MLHGLDRFRHTVIHAIIDLDDLLAHVVYLLSHLSVLRGACEADDGSWRRSLHSVPLEVLTWWQSSLRVFTKVGQRYQM